MSVALLVADSGPLIALAGLDLLRLLTRYFDSVLVTLSVWTEVMRKPGEDEGTRLTAAAKTNPFRVVPDPKIFPAALLRPGIDAGKRAAAGQRPSGQKARRGTGAAGRRHFGPVGSSA